MAGVKPSGDERPASSDPWAAARRGIAGRSFTYPSMFMVLVRAVAPPDHDVWVAIHDAARQVLVEKFGPVAATELMRWAADDAMVGPSGPTAAGRAMFDMMEVRFKDEGTG